MGRLLDRLLLREVVPAFLMGVFGFVFFFMVFDIFERLDVFVDNKTPFPLIVSYYASTVPYSAILVSPIAMLLSIFLVLGQMARYNEITAMKNAGLSLYRIFLPLFLFGLVVSGAMFWLGDSVMPHAAATRRQIYDERIRKRPPRQGGVRINVNYLGAGGRVYAVRRYDVRRKQMQDLVIQDFAGDRIVRRIDARAADWRDGRWTFRDGVVRHFAGEREEAAPFDSLTFAEITETPEDLTRDEVDPNQMSLAALRNYASRLRQAGHLTPLYDTEIHLKRAFPLVNLMAVLLAAPLATRLRRGGIAIGFGLSFILFLFYVGLVRFGQVLGHSGTIPPWPAAWLGNIVFGLMGLVLLVKAPK